MSDWFSDPLQSNLDKKKIDKQIDPVLYDSGDIIILLPEPPKNLNAQIKFFSKFFSGFKLISVLPYKVAEDEEIKKVVDTYEKDSINLSKFITSNSKIITVGRAIYAITKSDDLDVDCFADFIFNKSYFYSPQYNCTIFPIYNLDLILGLQSWERFFSIKQFTFFKEFEPINTRPEKLNIIILDSNEKVLEVYNKHKDTKKISIDTETNSLDFIKAKVALCQFSLDNYSSYLLLTDYFNPKEFGDFIKNKFQIYANGKYDIKVLLKHDVERDSLHIDHDIVNVGHILNEMRYNSLKSQAWLYTRYGGYDKELEDYKKKYKIKDYSKIDKPTLYSYAGMDTIVTYQIYLKQSEQLNWIDVNFPLSNGWNLNRYTYEIMIPALNCYIDMEYEGIIIDEKILEEESIYLEKIIKEKKNKFIEELNKLGIKTDNFNIESVDQLGKILEELKLPDLGRTKKGLYLTNDELLQKWQSQGYEIITYLMDYRKYAILQKTFVGRKSDNSGFWEYIRRHPDGTSRIHPTFSVGLADSHRDKCGDPNMQNIPAHGETVPLVKRHFITPGPDYEFLSADASGLQLRLGAIVSKDKLMRDIFINQSGDMHSITAVSILLGNKIDFRDFFKVKSAKEPYYIIDGKEKNLLVKKSEYKEGKILAEFIPKDARFKSKSINFGIQFGAKPSTLIGSVLEEGKWTEKDLDAYIKDNKLTLLELRGKKSKEITVTTDIRKKFLETYIGLEEWHNRSRAFAKKNGYIRSVYGAIRRLPPLLCEDDYDSGRQNNLLNIVLNSPVQDMESVVMKRIIIGLTKFKKENNLKSRLFDVVHDAIELYSHREEKALLKAKIIELATIAHEEYEGIPIEFEGNIADPLKGEIWDSGNPW